MTGKERIAKWLGAKKADNDLGNLEVGDIVLQPDGGRLVSVGYIAPLQDELLADYGYKYDIGGKSK